MEEHKQEHWRGLSAVIGAAVLWGISGTVAKFFFNQKISPILVVQIRLTVSALILLGWLYLRHRPLLKVERQDWPMLIILGIGGMAGVQFTYLYAVSKLNVALAVFIQYLSPVIVAVYNCLFIRQPLSKQGWGALALALSGSGLMITGPRLSLNSLPLDGLLMGLASAFAAAFYTLYGKRVLAKYNPWTTLAWSLFFGALPWWFINPFGEIIDQFQNTTFLIFFMYIAVLATILPFGLYFVGLAKITPAETIIVSMLEPVVAAVTAYLFLGELLSLQQLIGGGAILLAVYILSRGEQPPGKAELPFSQ